MKARKLKAMLDIEARKRRHEEVYMGLRIACGSCATASRFSYQFRIVRIHLDGVKPPGHNFGACRKPIHAPSAVVHFAHEDASSRHTELFSPALVECGCATGTHANTVAATGVAVTHDQPIAAASCMQLWT